jgi:hypothetical protein
MVKEYPILFSTPMVESLLDGWKCVTRRLTGLKSVNECPGNWEFVRFHDGYAKFCEKGNWINEKHIKCPYGNVGDLLWVREKWESESNNGKWVNFYAGNIEVRENVAYRGLTKWKPSIHLKKTDARIWLEIVGIEVQRIQDITQMEASNEGVEREWDDTVYWYKNYLGGLPSMYRASPLSSFISLWASINGADSWIDNPYVWVIHFKRVNKN